MNHIRIVNWERTQHYKNRNPPWIRLYTEIVDKYDKQGEKKKFRSLPDSAKLTFVLLLCLGSKYNNNIPFEDESELAKMIGVRKVNLKPLFEAGYIERASIPLAK